MKAFEEKLIYSGSSRLLVERRVESNFAFEWHYHDAYEITLILKGEGQRFVGDSIEAYKEGDLVFIPPHLAHTWKSAENSLKNEALYIQFSKDCLGVGCFDIEDFRDLKELMNSQGGFTFTVKKDLKQDFESILHVQGAERIIIFLSLLKKLAKGKKHELSSAHYKSDQDEETKKKMDQLMSIISSGAELEVPDIAKQLNMSESSFRRFVKKSSGRSLVDFVNMLRVSEASQMLMDGSRSISEIALECGYRNLSHFNRKFKEYKNLTPREFRKSFK